MELESEIMEKRSKEDRRFTGDIKQDTLRAGMVECHEGRPKDYEKASTGNKRMLKKVAHWNNNRLSLSRNP